MRIRFSLSINMYLIMLFVVLLILAVGFRPINIGTDTLIYSEYYNNLQGGRIKNFHFEFLFDLICGVFASSGLAVEYLFSFICLINFFIITLINKRINKYLEYPFSNYYLFVVLITCFCLSPFFFAAQVNVIRQGTAILAIFLFFASILCRAHVVSLILISVVCLGFHTTSILYLVAGILIYCSYTLVSNLVMALGLLYVTGINQFIISVVSGILGINIDAILKYGQIQGFGGSIRLDFALFTMVCGWGFYFIGTYLLPEKSRLKFIKLVKIYWILTIPFFLFGYTAFSERYLLPAWIFLSVLSAVFCALASSGSVVLSRVLYTGCITSILAFLIFAQGLLE